MQLVGKEGKYKPCLRDRNSVPWGALGVKTLKMRHAERESGGWKWPEDLRSLHRLRYSDPLPLSLSEQAPSFLVRCILFFLNSHLTLWTLQREHRQQEERAGGTLWAAGGTDLDPGRSIIIAGRRGNKGQQSPLDLLRSLSITELATSISAFFSPMTAARTLLPAYGQEP